MGNRSASSADREAAGGWRLEYYIETKWFNFALLCYSKYHNFAVQIFGWIVKNLLNRDEGNDLSV